MMPAGLPLLMLLTSARPAQACEDDTTTADLRLIIEEAEAAYIALDVDGVRDRLSALSEATPCLSEAIPRADAARYHRIQGLGAFIARDSEAASRAFLAARSIEPDAALPTSLVPEGHPVQVLYAQLSLDERQHGPLPEPAGGYLLLDGRQDTQRPLSHPVLLQRIAHSGSVEETAYLWGGDPLPAFPVAPPEPVVEAPPPVVEPAEPVTEAEPRGKVAVIIGTGVAAATTGAMFALNRSRRGDYYGEAITAAELPGTRAAINRSGAATLGAAALTAAGGLTLAVVW